MFIRRKEFTKNSSLILFLKTVFDFINYFKLKNRMYSSKDRNSSYSLNRPGAARNWINSFPQTAAGIFAFSSVFILLLCSGSNWVPPYLRFSNLCRVGGSMASPAREWSRWPRLNCILTTTPPYNPHTLWRSAQIRGHERRQLLITGSKCAWSANTNSHTPKFKSQPMVIDLFHLIWARFFYF